MAALALAAFSFAIRIAAQERVVLVDSTVSLRLHAPGEVAASVAERVGRKWHRGEYYLDYILDNRSSHDDWVLSAFMDSDTKIEILEVGVERPETRTIFSRTLPFQKEASLGGPYAVRLSVPHKNSRQYLVFLSDDRPVQLTLWSGDAYTAHTVKRHLLLGIFYGAILLLVLSQLTASFALADSSFFWFGLFILFSSISLCYWDGIAIETFHPARLPASGSLYYFGFANLSMVFGYLFLRRFINLRSVAPRLDRMVLAMASFQAVLTAIVPATRPVFFPWLVAVLGTVHASIQILGGIFAARRAVPSARLLVAGFALQVAATFLLFLQALGLTLLERLGFAITLFYPSVLGSAVFIAAALMGRIRAIDRARSAAETRTKAYGAYFSDLSHELMAHLRLLAASLAAHERRSPPSRELSSLHKNVDRLARSMDKLLGEPVPEAGPPPSRSGESTDLGAVVRDSVSALALAAAGDGPSPQIEIEPRLLVNVEAATVERIVDRTLEAVIAAGAWNEGTRISARQVGGRIELIAEMPSFACLEEARSPLPGGPGESVDRYIERGALPGGGRSLRVELPAASGSATRLPGFEEVGPALWGGQPRAARPDAVSPTGGEDRPRVLVVSDEPALKDRLAARLADGFSATTAEDAGAALELLSSEAEYGVVIVDLPGGIAEGHEVLKLVRSDPRRAGIGFIIAAEPGEREGRREVLAEGSVILLGRPLDLEEAAAAALDLSRRLSETRRRQEEEYRRRLELMLGGLSHAIKNPLSGITGPLAILRRISGRDLPPEAEKYLGQIEESAGRIGAILRDVRSALFAGKLKSEPIDLDALLGGIAESIGAAYPLSVVVRDPMDGITVLGDGLAARTIFENILTNAVEAMAGKGAIRVSMSQSPSRVEIEIQDRGPGIPKADIGRIFDPFFSTKGLGRGMGLGLAIVRSLAAAMSWEVVVSSETGEGASFRIGAPRFLPGSSAS